MKVIYEGTGDSKYRPCPLLRQYVDAGKGPYLPALAVTIRYCYASPRPLFTWLARSTVPDLQHVEDVE